LAWRLGDELVGSLDREDCSDALRADAGWKKLETGVFWDEEASPWLVSGSSMKLLHSESIWSLILISLTFFPHIGQDTMMIGSSGVAGKKETVRSPEEMQWIVVENCL